MTFNTPSTTAWSIGVGDPTIGAWLITAGYFIGALLCYKSYATLKANRTTPNVQKSITSFNTQLFWIFSGSIMILLGINKQLDLQTLLIQLFQSPSVKDDLQEQHRLGKKSFYLMFCAGTGYTLLVFSAILGKSITQVRLALIGLALLLIYIVFRAASIHQFQGATKSGAIIDRLMYFTEPVGVLALIYAASRFIQKTSSASEYKRDKT